MRKPLVKPLLLLLGSALLAVLALWVWWDFGERNRIHDAVISSAHLGPIPDSGYKARTSGNLFSRAYWITFVCDDVEFTKFVSASPGLQGVVPYFFPYSESDPTPTTRDEPPEYMREAMREADQFWHVDVDQSPEDKALWDRTKPRKKGRVYEIWLPDEAINGWLLRDDESGQALLAVRYS